MGASIRRKNRSYSATQEDAEVQSNQTSESAEALGYTLLIAISNTEKEYGLDNSLSNTLLLLLNLLLYTPKNGATQQP